MLSGCASVAFAADTATAFDLTVVVKQHSEVGLPNGKLSASFFAEGGGKMQVEGKTVRFSIACNGLDLYAGEKVADGVADCQLKSAGSGLVFAHFQKIFDAQGVWRQRGRFTFSGGTQDFAKVAATVPVFATELPLGEGGMAFLVEGGGSEAN